MSPKTAILPLGEWYSKPEGMMKNIDQFAIAVLNMKPGHGMSVIAKFLPRNRLKLLGIFDQLGGERSDGACYSFTVPSEDGRILVQCIE